MKSRVKLVLTPVAVAVVAALAVYGCGSSSVETTLTGGTGATGVVVAGGIANSPIDNAPLKAICADGSAGGTGVSVKGTYSMTVSCASTNFPVVISIDDTKIDDSNPPMMAGADLQFCSAAEKTAGTCDDVPYKKAERAPLKVAVPSTTEAANVVNMNAVTTLAAQTIEDKSAAVKAGTSTTKPTAADVQTAEAAIQTALGLSSVRSADPVRDAQVARVNAQVLEAVAVTKQLSAATVKPDDVMKAIATAATTGAAGQALVKTETDGSKSFDITTAQTALTAAATAITGTDAASVARKAAITAVNTAMTDTKAVEASIKSKGTSVEQVVKVISQVPSVQAFDPQKNTLASGTIAADIKAALDDTTKADNKAAKAASITANLATQAIAQAVAKAQEIDASTTIATAEKSNRKKAVFEAAETIRTSVVNDVTTATATAALTANQQAQAIAQVAMAVKVSGDQCKTEDITKLFDNSGTGKATIAGMAEKISSDIATQIATKTAANLGDINLINPATVMGATALSTITTTATNVVTALNSFTPPAGVDDSVVRAAVNTVIASMATTGVNLTSAATQTNIQNTITSIANSLNTALNTQVTVGGVTGTIDQLTDDSKLRLLTQTAQTMIGTTPLDFATPPTPGSVTTAITNAVTTVNTAINTTVVASSDTPTLSPTTLVNGAATPGVDSCSAEVKVSGINVGVPVKVTATVNGVSTAFGGNAFGTPPAPGAQPSASLLAYIKLSQGGAKIFPTPNGLLVGNVNNGQSFSLCVIPTAAATTYQLSAQVGSSYNFTTNEFADTSKLKSISFSTVSAAAPVTSTAPTSTTTTVPGATSTSSTTSTTLPACDPLAPPPQPGAPLTCIPGSSSSTSTTSTTAATTTTTTAATTTTTAATTTTTVAPTTTTAATTTTTTAAPTTTTTASTTTTTLGAAACRVSSGQSTAYVTGAPSCASSGTGTLGLNGLTATVIDSNVPAGVTAIAYSAITLSCDPFAAPPSPGAAVSSLLCKN